MLLVKEQSARPIHILLRAPEIIDRDDNPRHARLEFPSAPVIAKTPNRPQQQRRRYHVKQTQESNRQRQVRIEHVFRSADDVATEEERSHKIDGV